MGSTRAGGTGKTDLVAWIAARHPHLAILAHPTGDEDRWLREGFGARVFTASDWLRAWGGARDAGYAAAVCDGGLQDPALQDCPAACLELEEAAPGWADLLPFGRHRERRPRPRARLLRLLWGREIAVALDPASLPPPGTEIVAACSIARPEAFFDDLRSHGLVVREEIAFGDHHRFDTATLERAAARIPGATWVVTEKDRARAGQALPEGVFVARRILSVPPAVAVQIDAMVPGPRNKMDVTPRG